MNTIKYVGLDTYMDTIVIAIADTGRDGVRISGGHCSSVYMIISKLPVRQ